MSNGWIYNSESGRTKGREGLTRVGNGIKQIQQLLFYL